MLRRTLFAVCFWAAANCGGTGRLVAGEADPAGVRFFEAKIRPVLIQHCYECHSTKAEKVQGDVVLDSRAAILRGGPSGPAIVPGNSEESVLLAAIRHEDFEMPPAGKLPDEVIEDFVRWIEMGAPDPREGNAPAVTSTIDIEAGRQYWSYQLPRKSAPPHVNDRAWPRTNIDRFILARLEDQGQHPVMEADPPSRLRRLYLDLIGLPPTLTQIEAFLQDSSPEAWQRTVDQLLAFPGFGRRWGRHWLDVVRYSDSSGGGRTRIFQDAWRYRDYVIDALNKDKPYDQFVVEQIAGDLLPHRSPQQRAEQLTATSFLVLGPTNYELQDKGLLTMEVVDEQIDTLGRAMLGMTIGCARCHDHKFDPIPTRDYYALAGIFRSTQTLIHANVSDFVERTLPISSRWQRELSDHQAAVKTLKSQLQQAQSELAKLTGKPQQESSKDVPPSSLAGIVVDDLDATLQGNWTSSSSNPRFVGSNYLHDGASGKGSSSVVLRPELPRSGEYEVRVAYASGTNRSTRVPVRIVHADGEALVYVNQQKPAPIDGLFVTIGRFPFTAGRQATVTISNEGTTQHVIADAVQFLPAGQPVLADATSSPAEDAARQEMINSVESRVARSKKDLAALEARSPPSPPKVMSIRDVEQPGDFHICIRGNVHQPGDKVPRGFLRVADWQSDRELPKDTSGRLELAEWIASPSNPLTARVLVNRVWHHLLGRGIVKTTDNFGTTGSEPSHPRLLDHLAVDFVEHGWSIKHLIRRIVLSRVYQLSSQPSDELLTADPENQLLGRAHRRRLDAEVIRDAILSCSGRLDTRHGGKTLRPNTTSEFGYDFSSHRRSVYIPVFRNSPLDMFEAFDMADPNIVVGSRTPSTRPTQSLFMMNSPFVKEQADATADRLLALSNVTRGERIDAAYRMILGRGPNPSEAGLTSEFLSCPPTAADVSQHERECWSAVCQSLFSCLDFRYVK